jgi:hypothetical protein
VPGASVHFDRLVAHPAVVHLDRGAALCAARHAVEEVPRARPPRLGARGSLAAFVPRLDGERDLLLAAASS